MKKSIGLYADTRNFKTTLPQTKHLNFFMQTNPQGYANGGQVRPGIPQSNMQVTSGFLPMALGFQEGGEAYSFAEIYGAIVKVVAGYLGKSENDAQVQDEANKVAQTPEGQELAKKLLDQARGTDVEAEIKAQEGALNVPTQTFEGSTQEPPFGSVDVTPDATLPKVPSQQQQRDFEDEQSPSDFVPSVGPINPIPQQKFDEEEGIRGIPTERKTFIDKLLEGLKKADDYLEDAAEGDKKPLPSSDIDREREIKALEKSQIEGTQKTDDGGITSITPSGPDVDKEREVKESENQIIPKKKPKPDDEISTGTGRGEGALEYARRKTDLSKKEAEEVSTDLANLTGNKGKKDIPEWALPLASAGFAMMASKSPYFLQALGEAGQAGIATLSAQREAEEAKLDKAAERKYRNAMADFYEQGGSQSKGGLQAIGGKLYYKNTGEPYLIGKGDNKIHAKVELTRADAIKVLGQSYPGFLDIPNDDPRKEEIIQGYLDLVNGGNAALGEKVQNESTSESEGSWWSNIFNLPKIDEYLEGAAEG